MPLVRVNAEGGALVCADGHDLDRGLAVALSALPVGAPVLTMIHGYKYDPRDPARCPHRSILSTDSAARPLRCRSWPRAMGFDGKARGEGLCIAFGWQAAGMI